MKANPHRIVCPFFVPGTQVVAMDFRSQYRLNSLSLGARSLRGSFRLENLSDRFRTVPGALINVDPRLFSRVEARSRVRFARWTRLGRIKG